jgi:hypothetical protein
VSHDLYTSEKIQHDFEVPGALMPLVLAHPRLLPGETSDEYFLLFEMMVCTIAPDTDIEWLATIDLAWLQWEIQRLRRWKNAIILTNRTKALETALYETHHAAAVPGAITMIWAESKMNAEEIITKPGSHRDLETRLESRGYDTEAINAGAFVHSLVPLAAIEKFLSSARHQVTATLREVGLQREFARRATAAMKRVDADSAPEEPKQIEA